jgi:hypothetical protein
MQPLKGLLQTVRSDSFRSQQNTTHEGERLAQMEIPIDSNFLYRL